MTVWLKSRPQLGAVVRECPYTRWLAQRWLAALLSTVFYHGVNVHMCLPKYQWKLWKSYVGIRSLRAFRKNNINVLDRCKNNKLCTKYSVNDKVRISVKLGQEMIKFKSNLGNWTEWIMQLEREIVKLLVSLINFQINSKKLFIKCLLKYW